MPDTVRTFIAVEISEAVHDRALALAEMLRGAKAEVKWVERHNMHLTLKFLDEVPLSEIARVCEAVQRGVAGVEPFELEIRGAGAFPSPGRPRTLWLGGGAGSEQMGALFGRIEAALAKLRYRKEPRRFAPHLTIGRVRGQGPALAELGNLIRQHADFAAGRSFIDEVVVFSSRLGPQGPTYEALGRARLGANPNAAQS
jgi:RNA 2',3'-cyclic 3'-phosphodiesterase